MERVLSPERGNYKFWLRNVEVIRLARWIFLVVLAATCATSALSQAPAATPAPEKTVRVSASIANGMLVKKIDPVVAADPQGPAAVVLRATISQSGDVEGVQLISRPTDAAKAISDAVMQWKCTRPVLGGVPVKVEAPIIVALGPADTQLTDQQLANSASQEMKADNYEASLALSTALLDRYPPTKDDPALKKLPPNTLNLLQSIRFQMQLTENKQKYFEQTGIRAKSTGNGVTPPTLTYKVDPNFPPVASKVEGNILVNMIVDASGTPQNVCIVRGMGEGLNEAALRAVNQYRFKPAMEDGKPVAFSINVEIFVN